MEQIAHRFCGQPTDQQGVKLDLFSSDRLSYPSKIFLETCRTPEIVNTEKASSTGNVGACIGLASCIIEFEIL